MDLSYIVKNNDSYITVKQILREKFQLSARLITKLKTYQQIFLNDIPCFVNTSVYENDIIKVELNWEEDNSNVVPMNFPLDILYEDEHYLVINKPSGMAIHPSCDHYDTSLSNAVRYYFDTISLKKKIRPVNRLDKDTTGIVIFAKNEYIQECLIEQMKQNLFQKEYIAILDGKLDSLEGTINSPIARKPDSIIERQVSPEGDASITHYKVLRVGSNLSVVKFLLETGRTHQIRVHSQYIGHPILGDYLYGSISSLIDRQALHAYHVQFIHPITKEAVEYTAPLPEDMRRIIE